MKFRNLISLVVLLACVLTAIPGPAQQRPASSSPQESERQAAPATDNVVVSPTSPAVNLLKVGRKVAPGVIEVSPDVVRGRRLIVPAIKSGDERIVGICIGIYRKGGCLGVYIVMEE